MFTLYSTKVLICYWSECHMLRLVIVTLKSLFILYSTKFMICYWSEHCMVWPSLWFVTGQHTMLRPSWWFGTDQNAICYEQVYDLLLVRTLYVATKFMICYWLERCMLRPSWWFVTGENTMVWPSLWFGTGQNAMYNDKVWVLLLVRMPYVTTKPTICCWSVHCMLR